MSDAPLRRGILPTGMELGMTFRKVEDGAGRKFVPVLPLRFQREIGMIAMTVGPAFVLFLLIPAQLVPPVLSVLSFLTACVVGLYALLTTRDHDAEGSMIWSVGSVFTFTWIIAGLLSNPKHVLDWFDSLSMVP
jgi:hypothetical protein